MGSRQLQLVIAAHNKAKPAMAAVQSGLKRVASIGARTAKTMNTAWERLGKTVKRAGQIIKGMLKAAIIPLAILSLGLGLAVRQAVAFEQAMANVQAVLGGTDKEMKRVADAAREMGRTSVFTAQEAASAMYDLASAGFSADQVISSLRGTMLLAAATGSDLTFTTETMTSTIKQFGLAASDADRVANTFAAAISFSKLNMDRLATSMAFAGPVAAGFGHKLEGTVAVLSQFANLGLRASMIGTTFRMGLMQLTKAMPIEQIEKGADVLKRLNIEFKDIDPSVNSVADIVEKLHGKVTGMTEAMALFGVRAGGPWLKLITAGAAPLREMERKITDTTKAYQMSDIMIATLNGRLRIFRSAVQRAQEGLGTAFLPALTRIVDQFIAWVSIVNQIKWTEFFQGFQSGASQGAKKVEGILALFREGGPLRQAVTAWAYFFLDTIVDLAQIAWIPLETEFKVSMMRIAEAAKTQLADLPVIKQFLALQKITPLGFVARKLGAGIGGIGPKAQEQLREAGKERFVKASQQLMRRRPVEAVARTTQAAGEFRAAFAGNTEVVQKQQDSFSMLTTVFKDAFGKTHEIIAKSFAEIDAEIAEIKSMNAMLASKVKMRMSDGTTSVGAIQ